MNVLAAILMASASLHITVWPDGVGQQGRRSYTLSCAPVAGTLRDRASACSKLSRFTHPFAGTPKDMACTEIYGGPQEALITGRFRGWSVRAHFSRKDGCEIGRWNRIRFLFAGA
jgi:hypothetical protein